jgi:uncharacterized protein
LLTVASKKQGFASLTPERRAEIARIGGRTAHEQGRAHEFTPEQARDAGRKGGKIVASDKNHMREIGSKGGKTRARKAREKAAAEVADGE